MKPAAFEDFDPHDLDEAVDRRRGHLGPSLPLHRLHLIVEAIRGATRGA